MTEIILGLGSNLGNREENLRQAIELVEASLLDGIIQSHIYKSPPLLPKDAPAEWNHEFYNIVIAGNLKTSKVTPIEFLEEIKKYETKLGREPSEHWAPRVIDIDILAWGNEVIDRPTLKIPHTEMLKRDFVMKPLQEIRPGWRHP